MRADAKTELRRELGDDLDVLALLSDEESSDLLEMLEEARSGQIAALNAAIEETLGHLPRLLRGPARKVMFG